MIFDNCRIAIREVANNVGISFSSCRAIFMNDAQDCGKRIHESCTMITHQLTHRLRTKPSSQYGVFTAPGDFFLFPKLKTLTKGKCFAATEEVKEKSKKKKPSLSEMFRGLRGYFEGFNRVVIDK